MRWSAVALVAAVLVVACRSDGDADVVLPSPSQRATAATAAGCLTPRTPSNLDATLAGELRADLEDAANAPSELSTVLAPDSGISWAGGILQSGTAVDADTPFRIASVTKTFTAAAILRLYEQGKLDLDTATTNLLSPESLVALRGGGYDANSITVRHLLYHTSGLADYVFLPEFQTAVVSEPQRHWTRLEQVQLAMDYGEKEGEPGQVFVYSDTGYILLGEIIERVSQLSLAKAYRTLLRFEPLGLTSTYLESLEPVPNGVPQRAQQFFNDMDITEWDPSLDLYGGGGLVSTSADLARFFCALFQGGVFDEPGTVTLMQEPSDPGRAAKAGMGLFEREIAAKRCWGHEGFWGVRVVHCPASDVTIARTINQSSWPPTYNPYALDDVFAAALR
jgi:D-alanyl-D-alanine carboxypeptidase